VEDDVEEEAEASGRPAGGGRWLWHAKPADNQKDSDEQGQTILEVLLGLLVRREALE